MTEIEIWLQLWQLYLFDCGWGAQSLTPDMNAWCNGGWLV